MLELIIHFKRQSNYDSMSLAHGDLNAEEAEEMANIQILYQQIEMGKCVNYSDTMQDGSGDHNYFEHYYRDHVESLRNENIHPEAIAEEYEHRLRLLVMNMDKYEKVKSLHSSFELFLMKAHILSLGMLKHFDVESQNRGRFETALVNEEFHDSFKFPHVANICEHDLVGHEGQCLVACVKEFWPNSEIYSSAIQFLSIGFDEYFGTCFEKIFFPNVKYLRIVIGNDQYYRSEESIQDEKQLFSSLNKKAFSKLCHLSVTGIFDIEHLCLSGILDQLLYLDIVPYPYDANGYERKQHWNENGMPKFIQALTKEKCPLLHQLIVHATIHCKWPEITRDQMRNFYESTKNKFVASLAHSSIEDYYSTCYE
ncbi:hypothetical protein FDP41_000906 [Naegleria fowleri]|uniref:Uncharacterized protein n=1 Tax=Naegleria fowleri TaxID=5763 RepID=A0A6A5BP06_NAEFO|nr:uncharacterized protein FDP41_000906 [Naegleria fowleri]KAF0979753.1 hypothetical protein FDP41_000906 [Naegleria fowleri]CAG4715756.1 unnamed protein product [Naegleria fowleri]